MKDFCSEDAEVTPLGAFIKVDEDVLSEVSKSDTALLTELRDTLKKFADDSLSVFALLREVARERTPVLRQYYLEVISSQVANDCRKPIGIDWGLRRLAVTFHVNLTICYFTIADQHDIYARGRIMNFDAFKGQIEPAGSVDFMAAVELHECEQSTQSPCGIRLSNKTEDGEYTVYVTDSDLQRSLLNKDPGEELKKIIYSDFNCVITKYPDFLELLDRLDPSSEAFIILVRYILEVGKRDNEEPIERTSPMEVYITAHEDGSDYWFISLRSGHVQTEIELNALLGSGYREIRKGNK